MDAGQPERDSRAPSPRPTATPLGGRRGVCQRRAVPRRWTRLQGHAGTTVSPRHREGGLRGEGPGETARASSAEQANTLRTIAEAWSGGHTVPLPPGTLRRIGDHDTRDDLWGMLPHVAQRRVRGTKGFPC
jgi:hypothetical protein